MNDLVVNPVSDIKKISVLPKREDEIRKKKNYPKGNFNWLDYVFRESEEEKEPEIKIINKEPYREIVLEPLISEDKTILARRIYCC
jgi:hypothetical protein